jgi:hypothetical protein
MSPANQKALELQERVCRYPAEKMAIKAEVPVYSGEVTHLSTPKFPWKKDSPVSALNLNIAALD